MLLPAARLRPLPLGHLRVSATRVPEGPIAMTMTAWPSSCRWTTSVDDSPVGRVGGISPACPPIKIGEYVQAEILLRCQPADWIGAAVGLHDAGGIVDGASVFAWGDNTGRAALAFGPDGFPVVAPPESGSRAAAEVVLRLRLGWVDANTWRLLTSDDGRSWTPVGDDEFVLTPTMVATVALQWPRAHGFAAADYEVKTGTLA